MKQQLRRIKAAFSIAADLLYDGRRYFQYSQSGRAQLGKRQLKGRMLAKAHSIEKGLSLPEVRSWFGKDALRELSSRMADYAARGFDLNDPVYLKGGAAAAAYVDLHERRGGKAPPELQFVYETAAGSCNPDVGGVRSLKANDVRSAARGDFAQLSLSRSSVRMFSQEEVAEDLIAEAVRLAQKSPSVCNRQSSRVYVVKEDHLREKALQIQGGNRGFGDQVKCLLVICGDYDVFRDSKERNQVWVDGGLFSMSLMYALHYLGLGSCALNWSAGRQKDKRLRAALGIPGNEGVIMLLAVGHLRDEYIVASSPRRNLDEVLSWIA